jgi:ankyrin repeat protein
MLLIFMIFSAAEAGHTNIVQFLLNNGASIDVKGG